MIVIFGGRILQVSHPLYDRFALIVRACCLFCLFFNFPVAMIVFFLKRGHLGLGRILLVSHPSMIDLRSLRVLVFFLLFFLFGNRICRNGYTFFDGGHLNGGG